MKLRVQRVLVACLFLFCISPSLADKLKPLQITILHTNDTHGHLLPFSFPDIFQPGSDVSRLPYRKNVGGISRRSALVSKIRGEKDRKVLLVDSGDINDGTPFSVKYHGSADIDAMNASGYDVACPGNHDLNNPLAQSLKLKSDAKFPILCANLVNNGKQVYVPYIIKTIGTAKIAFLGLLTTESQTYPAVVEGKYVISDPIKKASELIPLLRKKADLVFILSHLGVKEDYRLAKSVKGVDVIIGGHSHTMLKNGSFAANTTAPIIVQDYMYGVFLGRLDLSLSRRNSGKWTITSRKEQLIPITSALNENPSVAKTVSKWWDPIKAAYDRVIGQATDDFAEKGEDSAEYNLVADAVREKTGADFEIENSGGVRFGLNKGPITYGDLVCMDPFNNTVVNFKAKGSQIKKWLIDSSLQFSGISCVINGKTVQSATINGIPMEDETIYKGSTNSYNAKNLSGEKMDVEDTGTPRLQALCDYISSHKVISPAYDGRRHKIKSKL